LQTGSYTNKEGRKVYTTEVIANRVEFLEWGEKTGQETGTQRRVAPQQQVTQNETPQQEQAPVQPSSIPQGFEAIDDDDIPF